MNGWCVRHMGGTLGGQSEILPAADVPAYLSSSSRQVAVDTEWADTRSALYDKNSLPAWPFRTDTWLG